MGTKAFLYLTIAIALLLSVGAVAEEIAGRTADGCSYKVINGQYLTSCPKPSTSPAAEKTAAAPLRKSEPSTSANSVTDYSAIPLRRGSTPAPTLSPSSRGESALAASAPVSSLEKDISSPELDDYDARRARLKSRMIDQTYVGLQVGASNMKESNAGSSAGLGLSLGTNIDDTFGVELAWSYARQDLNLGLASRGSSTDPSQNQSLLSSPRASDSSLTSNLFSGEIQAHLTDPVKRLRPFVGAGLGWRSASLNENADPTSGLSGGSLHQNALGGLASAGSKLRLTKTLNVGIALRYFFPLARQSSRLEQAAAPLSGQSLAQSRLNTGDDLLTGSSQYQILGSVSYAF